MATATEVRNDVKAAADQTSRSAVKTFNALSEYYLTVLDAGMKVQARAIETTKLMLDETAAVQRDSRKIADELVQRTAKVQQEFLDAADEGWKVANGR
jgi:hypothetical protein